MKEIYLCFLLFIHITSTFCRGSINTHTGKFGYQSASRGILDPEICSVRATCEPILFNTTCFGTALPYVTTSVALANDSTTQFDVQDNLAMFEGLRSIPRCWAVVQPLLCAIYMPKCENGSVSLPSQKMCSITREPCKFVETIKGWPSFLRCDNKKLFPSHCRNPLEEIKFNTTSKCIAPLTETDYEENYFHEVESCGLQCQDPFFSKKEHEDFHHFVFIASVLGLILSLFVMLTYIISWKAAMRFPGIIVFYINICLIPVAIGNLIQFFVEKERIVCNLDGTIRLQHPRFGEHLCTLTFLLTYYFLLAAIIWFVILSYALYVTFSESSGCPKDTLKKKNAYFHIAAWCIPLLLSVIIMAMKEVEGDSMSGICFVGNSESVILGRWGFLFAPIALAAAVSFFLLSFVLYSLRELKLENAEMRARKKLVCMMWKISIFSATALGIFISITVGLAYDSMNRGDWNISLRDYIVCLAKTSAQPYLNMGELPVTKCVLKGKPSVRLYYLQLSCLFFFRLMMFSWIVTRASIEAWKRFFYRCCAPSERKSKTLKKHAVIAKSFHHRHDINQGHYSFSLNSHDDPAGMNLDLNSIASRDISSSWAKALPQFIMRRNAAPFITPFHSRHYSSASDISRQMSVDSYNQQNLDSLSMQISEQDYAKHTRRRTRKERERFLRANRIAPWYPGNRRGSDTSLQSSLMTASIVAAAKSLGAKVTKSTSTGDLGVQAALQAAAYGTPMIPLGTTITSTPTIPLPSRNNIQREKINIPFMHGMDGSCGLDAGMNPRAVCRNIRPFVGATVGQRFTPYPNSGAQNTMSGVVRPPMYRPEYDMMNIPFGYIGGGMYPTINGMYTGYAAADFNYAAYSAAPYLGFGPQGAEALYQYQHSLIPLQPRVDSASETEYLPIIMSDSEYTDTGFRSYDEAQLLSACLMQQERLQAQAMAAAANAENTPHPKPALEPQADAKTQLLERMFNTSNKLTAPAVSRPASGKKTPHSEAPPPSPADSLRSLEMGDDDVFEEQTAAQEEEEVQETELSPLMEDKKGSSASLNKLKSS